MNGTEWSAKWCWTGKHAARPWNQYAYFRRALDLPGEARRAVVRVSADARYTLYVNSARVHQGPARSFPQFQSFDTLDIAHHLRRGRNALCAIVHQFGVPTFQSVYRDASGFLLDGVIEIDGNGQIPLHTPHGWLCRPAGAWRQDVARRTIQLGFQEHFDATLDTEGWLEPDYQPDAGWRDPFVAGPVGQHPWTTMEPRGVPLLAHHIHDFIVVAGFCGPDTTGAAEARDVYHISLQCARRDVQTPTIGTIEPPPLGEFRAVVLDAGQYRTGHFMLDVADAAGGEMIDVLYSEALDDRGMPLIVPAPSHCEEATADRYICRAGPQRWETFSFNGMRYATLVLRNLRRPIHLRRVALRQVHADVSDAGEFECSDERLNRIWRVARETQRNCTFDAFVDCPWREQAMWWGDARVQARVALHAFGPQALALLERGIRLVARSQADDGALHAHPPADVPKHRLPDFMLTWIATLWDWHFHTGRVDLVRECAPAMHRLLAFFERHEVRDGLIGAFEDWWVFLDWQDLYRDNFSAVLNLMYLGALRHAAALSRAIGETPDASRLQIKASRLAEEIERYFWDDTQRVWCDGFDAARATPVSTISQHANALAILLDLKPRHHQHVSREFLLKPATQAEGSVLTGSPFFYAYILEALFKTGLRREALDIIDQKWGRMLDRGATTFWEVWEPVFHSRCHAWSASPLYHLAEQVLGVMSLEAGWRRVRINPCTDGLSFARGVVPSPAGPIHVEWDALENQRPLLRYEAPEGTEVEIGGPFAPAATPATAG